MGVKSLIIAAKVPTSQHHHKPMDISANVRFTVLVYMNICKQGIGEALDLMSFFPATKQYHAVPRCRMILEGFQTRGHAAHLSPFGQEGLTEPE